MRCTGRSWASGPRWALSSAPSATRPPTRPRRPPAAADAVRSRGLVGEREPDRYRPVDRLIVRVDQTVQLVGPGGGRPVDRTVLEQVLSAATTASKAA